MEHFGFTDGISQPIIEGLGKTEPAADVIKAGEFLLGHPNEYDLYTSRPTLAPSADPRNHLASAVDQPSRKDLGRNGSYLVFRQLEQDVQGFRKYLEQKTKAADGTGQPAEALAFAARMLGRWQGGASLVRSPDKDDPALAAFNSFSYQKEDPYGLRCPFGSHVRRSNPRDSLDPNPGSAESVAIGKRHRLLRRGREYGAPLPGDGGPAGAEHDGRGLHFLCLNGNIARQFEFIQSTWINNPVFNGPLQRRRSGARFSLSVRGGISPSRLSRCGSGLSAYRGSYPYEEARISSCRASARFGISATLPD